MMSRGGTSLEFIMRSGYTRHLTRIIGVDMVRGSQEHEGARCSGSLNVYDFSSHYLVHFSHCSGCPIFFTESFLQRK